MMNYKVLMIDDQINDEAIKSFIKYAKISGIDIISCQYHEDGIRMLKEDKYHDIQAVILDATGFKNESDNILANNGLRYSLIELNALAKTRLIPWFVFTGASRNNNDEFRGEIEYFQTNIKFGRRDKVFYLKTIDEDDLINDIQFEINNIIQKSVYYQFAPVFKVIQGIAALEKHHTTLLEILKNIDTHQDYTKIRKVLESLFKALADINIIPQGFTEEKGWINSTSLFISGKHSDYEFTEPDFIHPAICETLYRILNMIQDGSHNEGALRYKVDEYSKLHTSGYLYKSIVYGLLEILTYFGKLIKENQDIEVNQSRWKKSIVATNNEFISGIVININSLKGYAFFKPDLPGDNVIIPSYLVANNALSEGMNIQVEIEEYLDNKDNVIKKRVKNIK